MRSKQSSLRSTDGGIVLLLGLFIAMVFFTVESINVAAESDKDVEYVDNYRIIKTVAHTKVPEDYILIHKDTENDIAYYIQGPGHVELHEGDYVIIAEAGIAEVVSITPKGFYLDMRNVNMRSGMSGSPVLKDNKTCGYVSSIMPTGYLYCIWS